MNDKKERIERSSDKKTSLSKEKKSEYLAEIELLRKEIREKDEVITKASEIIESSRQEYEKLLQQNDCNELLIKKIDRERNEYLQEARELKKELEKESKKKRATKQKNDKEFKESSKNYTNYQSKEELINNLNELLEENLELSKHNSNFNQEIKDLKELVRKSKTTEENYRVLQKEHEQAKAQLLSLSTDKKWLQERLNSEADLQALNNSKTNSKTPSKTIKKEPIEKLRSSPQTARLSPSKDKEKIPASNRLSSLVEESEILREWLSEHENLANLKNEGLNQMFMQDLLFQEKIYFSLKALIIKEVEKASKSSLNCRKLHEKITPIFDKIGEEKVIFEKASKELRDKLFLCTEMINEYKKQIIEWQDAFNQQLSIHEVEKSELESNIDLLKIEINERDRQLMNLLNMNADTFDELLKDSREKCYSVFENFEDLKEKSKVLARQKINLTQRIQELEKPSEAVVQREIADIFPRILDFFSGPAYKKEQLLLGKENYEKLLFEVLKKTWEVTDFYKLRAIQNGKDERKSEEYGRISSVERHLESEILMLREQISNFNKEKEMILSQINKYEILFGKVNKILEEGEEKMERLERERDEYKNELFRIKATIEKVGSVSHAAEGKYEGSLFFEKSKGPEHFDSFRLSFDNISMSHNQDLFHHDQAEQNSSILQRDIKEFEVRHTPPRNKDRESGSTSKIFKNSGKLIGLEEKLNKVRQQEQLLKRQLDSLERKQDF